MSARFGATGSWSRYHTGLDFAADVGTPVHAVVAGTVVEPTAGGWAGTHLIIRAADGSHTLYAHLSDADVAPGDTVTVGQQIGEVGRRGAHSVPTCTSSTTSPAPPRRHLHRLRPGALLRANGITHW
ncbi:murein hydrolase activator EnvC family protein [Tessaracoccus coleopterorum]|uniref:murein hydrolase activator EnvC family protein n=1 Tax=Tessaracoccus coleopterorum TaxID=2714950 RepID=UPI001E6462E6|nr:M23 family metallopeptidase [Tessaracoccus coleopterorum]